MNKKNYCSQCGKETEILNYCTCYICGLMDKCPKCKKRKINVAETTQHLVTKKLANPEDLKCSKCESKQKEILKITSKYYCDECLFNNKTEYCVCDFGGEGWRNCTVCGESFEFKSLCDGCFSKFKNKESQEKLRTRGVMDFVKDNWIWITGTAVAVGLVSFIFLWKRKKK